MSVIFLRVKQSKKMGPIYSPEASVPNHLRCVTTQKTEDFISITAKAEGHPHLVCDKEGCGWNFSRYSDVVPRYQKCESIRGAVPKRSANR
jgi:hypothetical protein